MVAYQRRGVSGYLPLSTGQNDAESRPLPIILA